VTKLAQFFWPSTPPRVNFLLNFAARYHVSVKAVATGDLFGAWDLEIGD
jgi:hypothetical protein